MARKIFICPVCWRTYHNGLWLKEVDDLQAICKKAKHWEFQLCFEHTPHNEEENDVYIPS